MGVEGLSSKPTRDFKPNRKPKVVAGLGIGVKGVKPTAWKLLEKALSPLRAGGKSFARASTSACWLRCFCSRHRAFFRRNSQLV